MWLTNHGLDPTSSTRGESTCEAFFSAKVIALAGSGAHLPSRYYSTVVLVTTGKVLYFRGGYWAALLEIFANAVFAHKATDRSSASGEVVIYAGVCASLFPRTQRHVSRFLLRTRSVANEKFKVVHVPSAGHHAAGALTKPLHTERLRVCIHIPVGSMVSSSGAAIVGFERFLSDACCCTAFLAQSIPQGGRCHRGSRFSCKDDDIVDFVCQFSKHAHVCCLDLFGDQLY